MSNSIDKEDYNTIDFAQYNNYVAKINEKYPHDKISSLKYAQEIMPGQFFLCYLCEILQTETIDYAFPTDSTPAKGEMVFTTEAIEMLLIAFSLMAKHMPKGLSEQIYDSILLKSSTFFNQLIYPIAQTHLLTS